MPQEELVAVLRAELGQFRQQMAEAGRIAQQTAGTSERAFEGMDKAIAAARTTLAAFGVTVGVGAVVKLGTDAVQTATRIQSLEAGMRAVTSSAGAAQQALGFVRAESERLGLEIESTTKSFQQLTAAARGTRLEGEETRRLFSAIATASRTLGLSVAETGGALNAVQQIISKGTVQAEELRGQLGERLPGAFQIAARAMGVTTAELGKLLEQGRVISEDFLPRFARQLEKELGGGAEEASRSAAASFTRLANEIKALSVSIGTSIISGLQPAVDFVTKTLAKLRQDREATREATGPPPATVPGDVPAPDLQRRAEEIRGQIERTQKLIEQLTPSSSSVFFPGFGQANQQQLERLGGVLTKLRGEYDQVLQRIEQVRERLNEGGTDATQIPFGAQALGLQKLLETMRKDLEAANLEFQLFGQGGGSEAGLEAAKNQLAEIEKTTREVAKNLAANPRGLEAQVPGIRTAVEELQRLLATSRLRVKTLEDEQETAKRLRQEEKQATAEAAREEERLVRQRVDMLADAEQFKEKQAETAAKAEEKRAKAAADAAFEEVKFRTEQNVALENRVKLEAEAAKQLDILAGRAESRFEAERERVKQRVADIEAVLGVTTETQRALADNLARIRREETAVAEAELKKQSAAYEQFAEQVQDTVGDRIFDILSGRVKSFNDLLGTIKDTFLRLLADMAAAAIARPIIIPAITAVLGAVGLGGDTTDPAAGSTGGSTGKGALGFATTLLGAGKTGQQLYQAAVSAGLISGGGSVTASGVAALGASVPVTITSTAPAVAATAAVPASSVGVSTAGAAAGLTAGTVVGGVGAGLGVGVATNQLLNLVGVKGQANTTLSGAAGGATAGAIIGSVIPGIGTLIGAAIGAIVGGVAGFFSGSGGVAPPGVQIRGGSGAPPQFGTNAAGQIDLLQGFQPEVLGRRISHEGLVNIQKAIETASVASIEPLIQTLRQFPLSLQRNAVGPLNALGEELRNRFKDLRFSGDDIAEQVKEFVEKTLPEATVEVFTPFQKVLERLAPVFKGLEEASIALEQRKNEILGDIRNTRNTLIEGVLTPTQLFARRRGQLEGAIDTFREASPEQQTLLAPQISAIAGDIFRQAQSLFGDDNDAVRAIQLELLDVLAEVETAVHTTFTTAQREIENQVEVLSASFSVQQSIDQGIQQSVDLLNRIAALLTPVGSFQTLPGQVHRVPRTGLALVHEGELIGRPSGSSAQVTVNVDARGASDPQAIGRTTASAVRSTLRSLQQSARYRQDRGL